MKTRFKILITLMFCIVSAGCSEHEPTRIVGGGKGELSTPAQSIIGLDNEVINQFDRRRAKTLKRYFASNPRWEIRKEKRYHGGTSELDAIEVIYAIRKENRNGRFETTLNGYYSDYGDGKSVFQTRVIISFGAYLGHGNDTTHITFLDSDQTEIETIIESEHAGTPGNSSYIVVRSRSINFEIYEQSKSLERMFTAQAIQELNEELTMVLENLEAIDKNGVSPVKKYYPFQRDESYFEISDGMQPGIYNIRAGFFTKEAGIIYVKVFDSKTNTQLSAERITQRTTREIGWSKEGKTVFNYESDLTVYEGDWDHQYMARFEIWFRAKNGEENKLAQKERLINGWEM